MSDSDPSRAPSSTAGSGAVVGEVGILPTGGTRTDHDAEFTAFAAAARGELGKTAWLLTGDAHLAAELVQDALVRTYVAWPRARQTDPLAYARRVLANSRIDMWRRRRREVLSAPASVPDSARASESVVVEHRDELVRALARLTTRQRRVVVLRYLVGLTEREVAADLGVSVGAVKSQASRGLSLLRAHLGPLGDDEGGPR
ncbi:SigE family RNA polymerase sigma factor [Cellulomonas chitinilytica]|uniref:SigE family RNA polymerase sigma factor n=1 Tax=Cellulomonas chitinilytica TaxID=398759 RepID=UPI0035716D74